MAIVISFAFVNIYGKLNGDYLGYEIDITLGLQIILFFASASPFYILLKYHNKQISKSGINEGAIISNRFYYFLIGILFLNIFFTLTYGLGIMTKDAYDAPGIIKTFIQVINRFSYLYGSFLFLIGCRKNDIRQFFIITLLLIIAYLRAGLGVIFYILLIYSIKYYCTIVKFISDRKISSIAVMLIFPILINSLYELRSYLRDQTDIEYNEPISGVFFGRLSSYSNLCLISDSPAYFLLNMQSLDDYFYQKQGFGGVLGQSYMPEVRPENIMYEVLNNSKNDNVSYMAGTPGILLLSFLKSPWISLLNLINIIFLIRISYYFFSRIPVKNSINLVFLLISYTLLSGVSNELYYLCFSSMVYYFLFKLRFI